MNILITGARAPIAIEWAFRLRKNNANKIIMADSMHFPVSRFSSHLDKYYTVRKPAVCARSYIEDILNIVDKEKIDLIIPTCEEVFYLAKYKEQLEKYAQLFSVDFDKLALLHNKYEFIKYISNLDVDKVETHLLNSSIDFEMWKKSHEYKKYILKPVFSRFGSEVIFDISKHTPARYPVIAQKKLTGKEFCSYSIAVKGVVVGHSCYSPKYKAGPGASIYFKPQQNEIIFNFARQISTKLNYTGQIAFDFIQTEDGCYPIECNPRGTSGLHLLPADFNLLEALANPRQFEHGQTQLPYQLKFAMWMYFFNNLKNYKYLEIKNDYQKAKDVFENLGSSGLNYLQIFSFLELIFRSRKTKLNLLKASTQDIEWNGCDFN